MRIVNPSNDEVIAETTRRVVWIEWVDSSTTFGWQSMERLKEREDLRCTSIGFVTREDDEQIAITTSRTCHGAAADVFTIPKVAITGMWEVTIP